MNVISGRTSQSKFAYTLLDAMSLEAYPVENAQSTFARNADTIQENHLIDPIPSDVHI
jgi:hypothetical protein